MKAHPHHSVISLVKEGVFVKCLAPMVRFSRLPFRVLSRRWGCDVAYSPMVMMESFHQSQKARDADLTSAPFDRPLVIQFAGHDPVVFAECFKMVCTQCDGVDLNCGCPETWVNGQGDGSALLNKPEVVADMIRQAVMSIPAGGARTGGRGEKEGEGEGEGEGRGEGAAGAGGRGEEEGEGEEMKNVMECAPVSMKMRIRKDLRETVEIAQRAQAAGVSWICVHGRTKQQNDSEPVNLEAIKAVKEAVSVPVIGNGGLMNMRGVERMREETGVDGVMAANGLLKNPAMFLGYESTPSDCIHDWMDLSCKLGMPFQFQHRHTSWMCWSGHPGGAAKRAEFNNCKSMSSAIDYLRSNIPPPSQLALQMFNNIDAKWSQSTSSSTPSSSSSTIMSSQL